MPAVMHSATPIPLMRNVVSFSFAHSSRFALTSDGTLWAWGYNSNFSKVLGTRPEKGPDGKPYAPLKFMTQVKDISCNFRTCFAVKEDGSVWTWGNGMNGVLRYSEPHSLPHLKKAKAVSTASFHLLILMQDGSLRGLGLNYKGEVGIGIGIEARERSVKVSEKNTKGHGKYVSMDTQDDRSLAVTEDGSVWLWGVGGIPDSCYDDTAYRPRKVPGMDAVRKGVLFDSSAQFYLKKDSSLWIQAGSSHMYPPWVTQGTGYAGDPHLVFAGVEDVAAYSLGTQRYVLILKKDGTVWQWGGEIGTDGNYNNLGTRYPEPQQIPIFAHSDESPKKTQ